jgi:uncharacterized protein YjdB
MRKRHTGLIKKILGVAMACMVSVTGLPGNLNSKTVVTAQAADDFDETLAKFPASYRSYLQALHEKYPNWKFEPLNTGLDWNTVIENEMDATTSGSGNKSVIQNTGINDILKRNLSCDYDTSTKSYIYKDTGFVSASKQTVAYFMDPRNFLNEVNIFQFENIAYDSSVHTLSGVKKILSGTFMDYSNGVFSYLNTSGKRVSSETTYAQVIYAAGKNYNISPYWLASKIKQEVSANGSGSTNGDYTSKDGTKRFLGYYNFFNIGANDGTDPITNGLTYASTGSTYLRPWTTPMRAIKGGAAFFEDKYISCYQNTGYLIKFNVDSRSGSLYSHQFMTAITGATSETVSTYNAHVSMGTLSDAKSFLIPVYENMPTLSNTVSITLAKSQTAKTSGSVNVRSGAGIAYDVKDTLTSGTSVTIISGKLADDGYSYSNLKYPYWFKIKYKSGSTTKTGYVFYENLTLTAKKTLAVGQSYTVAATNSKKNSDVVYWQSSNPAVATVDDNGKVTTKKKGSVIIYAFLGNGSMDAVQIKVESMVLSATTKSLIVGGSYTLKATLSSSNKTVTYKSSSTSIATVSKTGVVKGVKPGTATIKVTTSSGLKKTCKVTVNPTKPKVSVSGYSTSAIKLKWTKSKGATSYQIYRRVAGEETFQYIATVSNATTYRDSKLSIGVTYEYEVKAVAKSAGVSYTTTSATISQKTMPKQVTGLTATPASGSKTVTLSWKKVSGATGYIIYRKTKGGSYKRVKAITKASTLSYTDAGLKKNVVYYYKVRAYTKYNKATYKGLYSTSVKVKP